MTLRALRRIVARRRAVPLLVGLSLLFPVPEVNAGKGDKVSGDLSRMHRDYVRHIRGGERAASFAVPNPAVRVADGFVVVDATAVDDAVGLQRAMEALGLRRGARAGRLVSGRFPLAHIDDLADLPGLRFARPAYAIANAGETTSQGDAAARADEARSRFGIDGAGIKVGTLSDSYDCIGGATDDQAADDLPMDVDVVQEIDDCTDATDEGRAMMQIVHDLAPGSSQAFHTAFGGQADFANGIRELAGAGAEVIVDDVIYLAEPMFQDGIVARAVDDVAAAGVAYFSSAGNSGRDAYDVPFEPSGVSGELGELHDFGGGDTRQTIEVPGNATLQLALQWDSPHASAGGSTGADNDVDAFLYDDAGTKVAESIGDNIGGDPVEVISYTNPSSSTVAAELAIELFSGPAPGTLKYVIFSGGTIAEHVTDSSTLYGHANAAGAEAVGASAFFYTPAFGTDPPLLNPFSSAGPTPILFDASGDRFTEPVVRKKPEIVCVDGGNTTFFGRDSGADEDDFPNFFGTSAAAPHAAAIAALMLDHKPGLSNVDIFAALEATAIDMETAGFDDDSGYGLCHAEAALAAVSTGQIAVSRTATPSAVDEPGDSVDFAIRVDNVGSLDVSLESLQDGLYGDLDGRGDCAVPQAIPSGDFYECGVTATVSGNAGDSATATVTATADDSSGTTVEAVDAATVSIADVLPGINAQLSAGSASVLAPGQEVAFSVRVDNTSVEPVQLSALQDDLIGDLGGQGDCSLPQSIAVGGFYECGFTAPVTGSAGTSRTNRLDATASDDEGNVAAGDGAATVDVVAPRADLAVSVQDVGDPVRIGQLLEYRVTVINNGPERVTGTILTSDLPAGLSPSSTSGCAEDPDGVATCSLGTLQSGGTSLVTIRADTDSAATGTVSLSATVSAEDDYEETAPGDESASEATDIIEPVILFADGFEKRP